MQYLVLLLPAAVIGNLIWGVARYGREKHYGTHVGDGADGTFPWDR